jgi:sodium-dependent dicarboxylate transporter 2/3/5
MCAGTPDRITRAASRLGLVAGPLLAIAAHQGARGAGLGVEASATAGLGVLMACWWLTEAIPISATALLPLVVLPLAGGVRIDEAARPYANPVIFLFLGGFLLGHAMERWELHRRIALVVILLVGGGPRLVIGGFMLASAILSMWVTNTATAMMMVPIGASVIAMAPRPGAGTADGDAPPVRVFGAAVMLGIAYAASIGGVGTLIGSPPNMLLKGFLAGPGRVEISFLRWMLLGIPLVAVFLPLAWAYLTLVAFPMRGSSLLMGRQIARAQLAAAGPMSRAEWTVMAVFGITVALWISRPWVSRIPGLVRRTRGGGGGGDEVIAVMAAISLFVLPAGGAKGGRVLDAGSFARVPWGILVLFGGGLSLAAGISRSGLDEWIGGGFASLGHLPVPVLVLLVTTTALFLSELASNTALTAALLPILASAAVGMGVPPERLLVPATLAASLAFMLPVGTPPNAIVFGSGHVTQRQMMRAGLALNLLALVVINGAAIALVPLLTPG